MPPRAILAQADGVPSERPIRVLIVDDSVVARSVLERIIGQDGRFEVCAMVPSAAAALSYLAAQRVDIILLDVEMPGQSGLAALPEILRQSGNAKVIILSGNCGQGSASAVEALAMGASDIMSKPGSNAFGGQFSEQLIERLMRLGRRPVEQERDGTALPVALRKRPARAPIACLGVGASTGGIHALGQFFEGMGGGLGVPVLLTQHLPPSFMPYFATQLARMTPMPVKIAEDGDSLRPDHVYVAPGEANLTCRRWRSGQVTVVLDAAREPLASLPAVDPMFASMADTFGAGAVAVVLTGMGRDGTAGAGKIVAAGGWIVAQDAATSVVWGMPGSVARAGLASATLPPQHIGEYIGSQSAEAV